MDPLRNTCIDLVTQGHPDFHCVSIVTKRVSVLDQLQQRSGYDVQEPETV